MKILVVCQYYYPEPFRISDLCEEMAKRGHSVTVVTGLPNYPMGQIYDGYRHGNKRDEIIHNVKVHRCFTVGRRSGAFFRILNYFSYAISSSFYVSKLESDYDAVFVNQLSPIMMAKAGILYKKKHNKKMTLYCLDLWPESLTAGGIKPGSLVYKFLTKISSKIYHQADHIFVTSKAFSKYFVEKFGIERTEYLPQYAESIFSPEVCAKHPNGTVDLMFAGNIGIAQRVDTIIKAANLTKDIPELRWHIVGDGSELNGLKKLADELKIHNVLFHGRRPLEEMPKYYAMADAMLVTMQKGSAISLTLPGKIQTYMAAGKAIVGAIGGEASAVINEAECGVCCEAENADALANVVREMIHINSFDRFSHNAYIYYLKHFSKDRFVDVLLGSLE